MPKLLLAIVLAAGSSLSSFAAQDKPNFSGSWAFNEKASDPGPRSLDIKIEHKEPVLKYSASGTSAEGESFTEEAEFTIDGRVHPGPNSGTVSAHWEGATLVVLFKAGDEETKITFKLSADGKQMFRDLPDSHEVYDKQ